MKIVTPPITLEENESFEQDILDRSDFGRALMNLTTQSSDELVISLDGRWGEGKTTFVRMWQGMLQDNSISSVYIDAFANDYVDDAFIAIASAISTFIDKHTVDANKEKVEEFKEKAKTIGVQLLSWTAKVGIKAATLGAIKDSDLDEMKDIQKDIAAGLSSVVGDFVAERLESHAKDIELLESFKTLLSDIPTLITSSGDKPLVIILDELDRCKPTYAVELIEKVKHLFSVKNVVFILVMHRKQLEEAVKSVYGQNIDAHTYLQKFINVETTLPKHVDNHHKNDIVQYSQRLFELHEIEAWGDKRILLKGIEALAKYFNLSLRQLERVYTNISIFYASSDKSQLILTPVISFLAIIKVINPRVYEALSHGKMTYDKLCDETGISDNIEHTDEHKRTLQSIAMWLKFSLITDEEFQSLDEKDRTKNLGNSLWEYSIDRQEIISIFTKQLNLFTVV